MGIRGLSRTRDSVAQHLVRGDLEEPGYLHRFELLHLPLAPQHPRNRRWSEAKMAREIRLSSPDPVESMLEPGCVHWCFYNNYVIDIYRDCDIILM